MGIGGLEFGSGVTRFPGLVFRCASISSSDECYLLTHSLTEGLEIDSPMPPQSVLIIEIEIETEHTEATDKTE